MVVFFKYRPLKKIGSNHAHQICVCPFSVKEMTNKKYEPMLLKSPLGGKGWFFFFFF